MLLLPPTTLLAPPVLAMPSMASTLRRPTSGVDPPPRDGTALLATPGTRAMLTSPGNGASSSWSSSSAFASLPVRGMYAVPSCCCTAAMLEMVAEGLALVVACFTATCCRYWRCFFSCCFLLGFMPWKLRAGGRYGEVRQHAGLQQMGHP